MFPAPGGGHNQPDVAIDVQETSAGSPTRAGPPCGRDQHGHAQREVAQPPSPLGQRQPQAAVADRQPDAPGLPVDAERPGSERTRRVDGDPVAAVPALDRVRRHSAKRAPSCLTGPGWPCSSRRIRQACLKQVEVEADDRVDIALAAKRHEVGISSVASQSAGLRRIVDVDRVATNARDVLPGLCARDLPPELGSHEHTLELPDQRRTYDDGELLSDRCPDDEIRGGPWPADRC